MNTYSIKTNINEYVYKRKTNRLIKIIPLNNVLTEIRNQSINIREIKELFGKKYKISKTLDGCVIIYYKEN